MTFYDEVLSALRNSIDVALYVEAAGVESCPNAVLIRSLNLCAMGPALEAALAEAWATGLPPSTLASRVLQSAHDRFACSVMEANF
jgi:hypothetical protein